MSSVPGAPLPFEGPPSPPANPWTTFATVGGAIAVVAGIVLMIVGASDQDDSAASPATFLVGASISCLGLLLLICALVLAGVDWYLRHPRDVASITTGSTT